MSMPPTERVRAVRLGAAIRAYVGSMATACDEIGVAPTRRYGDEGERIPLLERRRAMRLGATVEPR